MQEKPYHHGDLRNCLIENGISLIHAEGIDHLSLRRVAALCGVKRFAMMLFICILIFPFA